MRELEPEVLTARLRLISDIVRDLSDLGAVSADDMRADRYKRYAIERMLTAIVDLATAINNHVAVVQLGRAARDYRESFLLAAQANVITEDLASRLTPSVGLRNVVTHAYLDIDLDRIATAVPLAVSDYGEYVRQSARWLAAQTDSPETAYGRTNQT